MSTPANETPRTDAQLAMVNDECRISGDDTFAEVSAWDFARQLERELNEAREQIATLQGQTRWRCKCGGINCEGQRENERLRAELNAAHDVKLRVCALTEYVSSQRWSVAGRYSTESAIERMKEQDIAIERLRSELEALRTTEQCQRCHKHLSPSLIEAGTCVLCALDSARTELAKLKNNYSRPDAQPR